MRIGVALALALSSAGGNMALAEPPAPTAATSPTFAESAALMAVSPTGDRELSLRVARFPGRGAATLWLALFIGDERYGAALEDVHLGAFTGRTPVEDREVSFAVEGPAQARLECRNRDTAAMRCTAHAEALAFATNDPPLGNGTLPVSIDAEFVARHRATPARAGRVEVFGTVKATLTTPKGVTRFEAPGKWHEQTGERPRFAAAFTYFTIQGSGASLLAGLSGGSPWGFAVLDGATVDVSTFTIAPLGPPSRSFRVELADGRVIEGETAIVRETSVPIEGQRRPSATVRVETNLGPMSGHLNDWNPPR